MSFSRPMTLAEVIQASVLQSKTKSVDQVAEEMGKKNPGTLYRELNPNDPGAKLGVLDLIPLLRATGDLSPLIYINQALGLVAFPAPPLDGDLGDLTARVASATKEFGEMLTEVSGSLADGNLNDEERRRCLKETYEVRQAVAALYLMLEAKS